MIIQKVRPPLRLPLPDLNWSALTEIPEGWLPVEIVVDQAIIRWMKVGSAALSEPFYLSSVGRLRGESAELETDFSVLRNLSAHLPRVAPAGIIFNMSRCGSTLLVNALRKAQNVVGLSEAGPMEDMIELVASKSNYWASQAKGALSPLTAVFSCYQGSPAKSVVIKCAPGAVAALPLLRRLWPDVPCIILIRNPVEVLVSNLEEPPYWLSTAYDDSRGDHLFGGLFGTPPTEAMNLGPADLCAWAIGRYCDESLRVVDDKCRVVAYEDLTPDTVMDIALFFGLRFSSEGLQNFRESFRRHAKYPRRTFENDSESKRAQASEYLMKASDRWVGTSYNELRQKAYREWRKEVVFGGSEL